MSQDRLIGVDEDAIEQNFDEGQKNTILRLVEDTENGITNAVDGALAEKLEEEGLDSQAIKALKRFTDEQPKKREFDDKFDRMHSIWQNNGVLPGAPSHRFSLDDLIQADQKRKSSFEAGKIKRDEFYDTQFAFEQPMLIPKVVSQIVRDAIEPTIALTPLLQRINFQVGTSLTFPAMGAFAAADIPEGGEYPEQTMEFAGQVTATIGKSGVAVKFTDEMLRYSLFDVMSMHLRAAGRALIRHKEGMVRLPSKISSVCMPVWSMMVMYQMQSSCIHSDGSPSHLIPNCVHLDLPTTAKCSKTMLVALVQAENSVLED